MPLNRYTRISLFPNEKRRNRLCTGKSYYLYVSEFPAKKTHKSLLRQFHTSAEGFAILRYAFDKSHTAGFSMFLPCGPRLFFEASQASASEAWGNRLLISSIPDSGRLTFLWFGVIFLEESRALKLFLGRESALAAIFRHAWRSGFGWKLSGKETTHENCDNIRKRASISAFWAYGAV